MLPSSSPSLSRTGSFEDLLAATEVAPSSSSASPNLENKFRSAFATKARFDELLLIFSIFGCHRQLTRRLFRLHSRADSLICLGVQFVFHHALQLEVRINFLKEIARNQEIRMVSHLDALTFTICAKHVHWNTWREWSKRSESHVHKIVICFVYHCSKKFNIHRSSLILLRIKSMLFRAKLT